MFRFVLIWGGGLALSIAVGKYISRELQKVMDEQRTRG
jgi:hypothetical protein